jgi:predicted TPR repeat methyltransferase
MQEVSIMGAATQQDRNVDLSPDKVLHTLDGFLASASLATAFELELFWILDKHSLSVGAVADELDLPRQRAAYWLQYLTILGYLEGDPDGYQVSQETRASILETYSQETWSLLAQEAREKYSLVRWMPSHFQAPGSFETLLEQPLANYIEQMNEDPERAERFTRMLYEIHQDLAEALAGKLNLKGVDRMMDLGGGSGVISSALLRANSELQAVVIDIPNVCRVAEQLAVEAGLSDRLTFRPSNFLEDPLPGNFDLILECDVGVYELDLFRKLKRSLNDSGRLIIVDQFQEHKDRAPDSRIVWAVEGSLLNPRFTYRRISDLVGMLGQAGFGQLTHEPLPVEHARTRRFVGDMFIIEARC